MSTSKEQAPSAQIDYFARITRGIVVATVPTVILGSILFGFHLGKPTYPNEPLKYFFLDMVVANPLIETALMFPVLALLRRLGLKNEFLAWGSAILWALAHGLRFKTQGIMVLWIFYVFSKNIITCDPVSRNGAFLSTAAIHSVHNLIITLLEILFWF